MKHSHMPGKQNMSFTFLDDFEIDLLSDFLEYDCGMCVLQTSSDFKHFTLIPRGSVPGTKVFIPEPTV